MRKENLVVGCCGFPVSIERYARVLAAVETQQTFYKLIPEKTAHTWRRRVDAIDPSFEFSVKAHQFITHPPHMKTYLRAGVRIPEDKMENYGYFRPTNDVFEAWKHTLKIAEGLRARAVLLQSPPSFNETRENLENTTSFFDRVRGCNVLLFWEPRGKWQEKTLKDICEQYDVYHCVDPFTRRPLTGVYFYFRLHGGKRYQYTYTEKDLEDLASMVTRLEGERCYIFFNNRSMFSDAQRFLQIMKG